MGADLAIAIAAAPRFNIAASREVARITADYVATNTQAYGYSTPYLVIAAEVGVARLAAMTLYPGSFEWHEDYLYDDPEHVYPQPQLQAWAAELVRGIFGPRRDTTTITIAGRDYLITGGMTWGDEPTDSFRGIEFLDDLDVFGKIITLAEVRAAVAKIEGPQPVIEE